MAFRLGSMSSGRAKVRAIAYDDLRWGNDRRSVMKALELKDLGETEILKILHQFCPAEIIGDDGAVLDLKRKHSLVVTTDVLVDGVHFSDQTMSPEMAGWRAVAANLSDLAAMGATPVGITVGLSLPENTPLSWLRRLYSGIDDCLQTYGVPLVGGDLTRSPTKTIAISAFGEACRTEVMHRHSAQAGDVIVATGYHGDSRAGLELLLRPETGQELDEEDRLHLISAHQRPMPRLDIVKCLKTFKLERPVAAMDSSDGLADAIIQICQRSQVGAEIRTMDIPLSPALTCYQTQELALYWALYGGEDFELVLCLPEKYAIMLVEQFNHGCRIIGRIRQDKEINLVDLLWRSQPLTRQAAFQHFE